jgi:hypothetical protein
VPARVAQRQSKILSGNRLGVYNLLVVLFNNLYTPLMSLCEYKYHLVHYTLILTRSDQDSSLISSPLEINYGGVLTILLECMKMNQSTFFFKKNKIRGLGLEGIVRLMKSVFHSFDSRQTKKQQQTARGNGQRTRSTEVKLFTTLHNLSEE